MIEASKLGQRAAKVGFDWPEVKGLFHKLAEEAAELEAEVEAGATSAVEEELGDLLFTAVNLARHLQVEPEFALRSANAKFRTRFNCMETLAGGIAGMQAAAPAELDRMWNAAKQQLSGSAEASPSACESHPGNSSPPQD